MKWILSTVLGLGVMFTSSSSVFAQTCELKAIQPGTLTLVLGNPGKLSSRSDKSPNAKLASITLTCMAGMQLRINPPTAQQVPTFSKATSGIEVWRGSPPTGALLTEVTSSPVDITLPGPFTDQTISFDLYVNSASGNLLVAGDYTYNFQIRITPQ